ncbi:MAG: hypothetical protein KKC46_20105 [Proteobacteria bacterium]|nr:hypothetical protein [Pseudomonadota bacterium]
MVDDPEIFQLFALQHIERYPKIFKEPALKALRENSPTFQSAKTKHQKLLEIEVWEADIRPKVLVAFYESIERKSDEHRVKNLKMIEDVQRQIIYKGETASKACEQLGRDLLMKHHSRGGKTFKTIFHQEIIKVMYRELQGAIKKIRKDIDVSCTKRVCDAWSGNDKTENILHFVPEYEEIFDRKELPIITVKSSVADCAILIIRKRLKSYLPPQSSDTNSLKRLLQK